jgi:hypothetical protein
MEMDRDFLEAALLLIMELFLRIRILSILSWREEYLKLAIKSTTLMIFIT